MLPGSASAVASLPEVGGAAGNAVAVCFDLRRLALCLIRPVQAVFQNTGNDASEGVVLYARALLQDASRRNLPYRCSSLVRATQAL